MDHTDINMSVLSAASCSAAEQLLYRVCVCVSVSMQTCASLLHNGLSMSQESVRVRAGFPFLGHLD